MDFQREEEIRWFAMRDLKRPNAKQPAYRQLANSGIEVFTPMRPRLKTKNGRRIRENVPFIQDLLFVHDSRETIDRIIAKTPTLQYRYMKGRGYCNPMIVPDADMERFIHAANASDHPEYYLPGELTPDLCGRPVRIIGGALDGYEGRLLTVRGSGTKRLLVELPGFFSMGIEVEPEYIQLLPADPKNR